MSERLRLLAKRVAEDPFFLACALHLYAESEGMTETQVAAALGCSEETLTQVRLCRTPAEDAKAFQADVDRIAEKFGIRPGTLAAAVRRGQVLLKMRVPRTGGATSFMAARDRNPRSGGEA